MLSEKTWKTEAILRLLLGAVICFFAGSFLVTGIQHADSLAWNHLRVLLLVAVSVVFLGTSLVLLGYVWGREDALLRLALVLACFYAGLLVGAWASKLAGTVQPSVEQIIISALSLQGAILILVIPFLKEHNVTWAAAFGFKNRWVLAVLLGVFVGCVFLPLGAFLQYLSGTLMERVDLKPAQQQVVQTLRAHDASVARAAFGVISILLVPPAEESFFRGILYPWIKRAGYPRLALWGTSLLFAATHTNMMSFIPLAIFALALTLLYDATDNLLAPITAHAVFNGGNLVSLYLMERNPHAGISFL